MASGSHSFPGIYTGLAASGPAQASATTQTREHSTTYYPAFDWLRIGLALMVMLHHAEMFPWEQLGHFRVQVFFALSGWLVGRSLLRTSRSELPRFYFERVIRIWIPYALALTLLLAASLLRDAVTPKYLEFVLYKLTFVYNLFGTPQYAEHSGEMPLQGTGNHFWSICAEEQFYLFAPLVLVVLPTRWGRSPWFWCALAGVGVFSSISLGVAASIVHTRHGGVHLTRRAQAVFACVVVVGATLIGLDARCYDFAVPLVALAIVLLLARPGRKTALGAFWGGMSYQLYLNHWIGLFAAHSVAQRLSLDATWTTLLFGFPLSLLLAGTLYLAVDKQTMGSRRAWYTPQRAMLAACAAYTLTTIGLMLALFYEVTRS